MRNSQESGVKQIEALKKYAEEVDLQISFEISDHNNALGSYGITNAMCIN